MERQVVFVTIDPHAAGEARTATVSPWLMRWLKLTKGQSSTLRFGLAEVKAVWRADRDLGDAHLRLSKPLAGALGLGTPLSLTIFRTDRGQMVLGPLVAMLISEAKLEAVLNGKRDHVYCRYALAAREAGGVLLFCTADGVDCQRRRINGYVHHCAYAGECHWTPLEIPLPRVIYDRAFGKAARARAAELRRELNEVGPVILNNPVKITKLQAFTALQPPGDLAPHLPLTVPFTPEALAHLVDEHDDLYVKPDSLYKGQGVCRLTRQGDGWALQTRAEWGNETRWIARKEDLPGALSEFLHPDLSYVVQEGLPLATYLGNRFDLRSLVQRDGQACWQVTGVVARIAPAGSAITSPRSGGQIAPIDDALRDAFGQRAGAVRAEIDRVSLALAKRLDRSLGPCAELGLDLGVVADGTVKLIEANGIPLRVSLERLRDPLVAGRIDRYPIQFAAYLDTLG